MDRDGIAEVLKHYFATSTDVKVAYLFGSVVRGDANVMSDIDVGVEASSRRVQRPSLDTDGLLYVHVPKPRKTGENRGKLRNAH